MVFYCSPKIPASTYPQRLPEYLRKHQRSSSSSSLFLERLAKDADAAAIDEVSSVLGRSFAGNPQRSGEAMFQWAIGPDFPVDDPTGADQRIAFVGWYMKWVVLTCLEYGVVLVARDGSPDRKVLGAICATPPGRSYTCTNTSLRWHVIKIALRMGGPPPAILGKQPVKNMEEMGKLMAKVHDQAEAATTASNPSGTPPRYVAVLGTDVSAQGKGCGTALLEAIHYLADCDAVDTMLEYSGEKKRRFYCDKMGYRNFGEAHRVADPRNDRDDLAFSGRAAIRDHRQPRLPQ